MRYYPIFVNLTGKKCLVVGAGQVGRRKIATLASCGAAETLVLDVADPGPEFDAIRSLPGVRFERRAFVAQDIAGRTLVIASTNDEELNWTISRLCAAQNILCNIVDQPEKCGFIVPAILSQGDLTVAVSTGGASPALARRIRQDLGDFFGSGYGALLILMSRLRPHIIGLGHGAEANAAVFRRLVNSDLLSALENKDLAAAKAVLLAELPPELHPLAGELLDGLY
ncbi:MAG: bifunctional precorrin-2 dehydrogenase/sirohydrochlorin ferrochelatase [Desulfovibrionaceae bacterium]|nr:bifunctional precorrin-2 dehydrogenase/sirohydrochlorin ferrochelatase [Desulfovibrionaceae bacterium]MBF0513925.1 bifunctional precorrin-2 dehydrogenase/sirohydrochlorin ferrochelatase [Desulfovibrionaceae bacterium]